MRVFSHPSLRGSPAKGGSASGGKGRSNLSWKDCFVAALLAMTFVSFCSLSYAETGEAVIRGTAESSTMSGIATVTDTGEDFIRLHILLSRAPTGKHGFHIHEFGSCEDTGQAAGGHYNPDGAPHGDVLKDGFMKAHAGDFGNIEVGPDGNADMTVTMQGLSLSGGKRSVAGRSIIIHEKEDDFGQPAGNAGGRIACGTIYITQNPA